MLQFTVRRMILLIPTVIITSMVAFVVIQLPPGDFMTAVAARYASQGETIDETALASMRANYGLDQPVYVQYLKWTANIITRGDFGYSFLWSQPVSRLVWDRLGLTMLLSLLTLFFTWMIAFPIGIYSAVKQYSLGDYLFTVIGYIGLAVPGFLMALVLMWVSFKYFGVTLGGLFSDAFVKAPWSLAKVLDMARHIWIPIIILGTSGTASLIRVMRANLLDELHRPYVTTARSKGMPETRLLIKYPVRLALNPFISTVGWSLPTLVSGETIVAVVLSLPTSGPMLLQALMSQDMYLAGTFILLLSVLTIVGTLISDVLLALLDPRIRFEV
jgi:peptide/nickel transport system permease protein